MKKIQFDHNKNVISGRLREYRLKSGLTQGQLAAKMQTLGASIDQQMISRIEHNTRCVTDYEFACLCACLGVSPSDMLRDFYDQYL